MTTEEKRQLLIEFRNFLIANQHLTASFIYHPKDINNFLSTLPDEGEKAIEIIDTSISESLQEHLAVKNACRMLCFSMGGTKPQFDNWWDNYCNSKTQTP